MAKFNKSDIVISKTGSIYKVLEYFSPKQFVGENIIGLITDTLLDSECALFIPGKIFENNRDLFLPVLNKIVFTIDLKNLALKNLFGVENKENFIVGVILVKSQIKLEFLY